MAPVYQKDRLIRLAGGNELKWNIHELAGVKLHKGIKILKFLENILF